MSSNPDVYPSRATSPRPRADLVLEPPQRRWSTVPVSSADQMVKLDPADRRHHRQHVAGFVDSLLALDTHSGGLRRQGALGPGPRRQGDPRLGQCLQPAARPSRQRDDQGWAGQDRADLDFAGRAAAPGRGPRPHQAGAAGAAQAARHHPLRQQAARLLPEVPVGPDAPRQDHPVALPRPGRAATGQRRRGAGEGQPVARDAASPGVRLHGQEAGRRHRGPRHRHPGHRPRARQDPPG